MTGKSKFFAIAGGAALALAAFLWWAPLFHSYSASTLHSLCNSDLGILAQGLSPQAQKDCGDVSGLGGFCVFLLIAGVISLVAALITSKPKEGGLL